MTLSIEQCTDRAEWDAAINAALGHPMQLWGWGQTKAAHNWTVDRVLVKDTAGVLVGSAQLLFRRLPFPFRSLAYIARGPQAAAGCSADVLDAVADYVKSMHRSVVLSIEPDWELDSPPAKALSAEGWRRSPNTILIGRTLILDLQRSEDELLAAMTKKTRQYIRKSGREALSYRRVSREELPGCLAVYRMTAERAGFGIHADGYYLDIFDNLGEHSPVFAAFDGDEVVAFLWLATSAGTAFELYGGMNDAGQNLRANFTLKWTAITAMKERGVRRYDFNGLLNDGVSQFKFGFADHEDILAGTWDMPLSRLYPVYARALPLARTSVRKTLALVAAAPTALAGLRKRAARNNRPQ
ncbi:peptidoglycan bridge formation glycyltransferase FemA/FemB family protein [Paenarthrobacter sp. PH39-S1]|uniref:lipid II:glycine glycyltransferase FemX n=1 Tax=Paenarthrobacter sp. PH39-S1 TaxID=3046204 RepID=UPI0024BB6D4E|nr:peptidoglycan bridge formation glycyltransferase FemA/FemB family protein [Paenarthrobacter sp. PH39-S1]MDJ0356166.1 peptidoglycan bridge formation glycyltransferase FemA/FemB family protein [Paenarthrobacter sp. PH39-S1]